MVRKRFKVMRLYRLLGLHLVILLVFCGKKQPVLTDLTGRGFSLWQTGTGAWVEAGSAGLRTDNPKFLNYDSGKGVFINGDEGDTNPLISQDSFGDIRAHIEFMVPENSNSGVYFQGRYEIQIFDSWNREPSYAGNCCGGIYERWDEDREPKGFEGHNPAVNASYPPGIWQTFDVLFRAPEFNSAGEKIRNAEFVKVLHNGIPVHEKVLLTGPTRAGLFEDEQPAGPLMLQGDHGPVAYRQIRVSPDIRGEDLEWQPLFDGTTLDGWDILPGGMWEVKEGLIVGTSPASETRHGILLCKEKVADFTLRLKYRALHGNSGLYFRVDTVKSDVTVHGFQAEIDEAKDIGGLYETGGRGWVVQPGADQVAAYFNPQAWNEMIIAARGRHVLVFVNGHKTASLIDDRGRTEGFLGLQLHGNMKMHVQFKDIEIIKFQGESQ